MYLRHQHDKSWHQQLSAFLGVHKLEQLMGLTECMTVDVCHDYPSASQDFALQHVLDISELDSFGAQFDFNMGHVQLRKHT